MANKSGHKEFHSDEHKPPVFQRWRSWYAIVLSALVFYIIMLYLFTNLY